MKNRIGRDDLLMAGWHTLYYPHIGTRWAHPGLDGDYSFPDAAKILKQRGLDEWGEMN